MALILVGCEYSGVLRRALRAKGHDAWSCDILPAEDDSPYHLQADLFEVLRKTRWDQAHFFPPCTDLCVSGAKHFKQKREDGRQQKAIQFFLKCATTGIRRWSIENPIGIMSSEYRPPNQIIQPWQFGHPETKATCLWLQGLPLLKPTNIVSGREARIHRMAPGPERAKERSRTYSGIAQAMADAWS